MIQLFFLHNARCRLLAVFAVSFFILPVGLVAQSFVPPVDVSAQSKLGADPARPGTVSAPESCFVELQINETGDQSGKVVFVVAKAENISGEFAHLVRPFYEEDPVDYVLEIHSAERGSPVLHSYELSSSRFVIAESLGAPNPNGQVIEFARGTIETIIPTDSLADTVSVRFGDTVIPLSVSKDVLTCKNPPPLPGPPKESYELFFENGRQVDETLPTTAPENTPAPTSFFGRMGAAISGGLSRISTALRSFTATLFGSRDVSPLTPVEVQFPAASSNGSNTNGTAGTQKQNTGGASSQTPVESKSIESVTPLEGAPPQIKDRLKPINLSQ